MVCLVCSLDSDVNHLGIICIGGKMKKIGNKIISVLLMFTIVFSTLSSNPNIHADSEEDKLIKASSITESDITVSLGSTNPNFKTYRDPVTGLWSNRMNVSLTLNVMTTGIEGLKVELPFDGFKPSLNDPVFDSFTMREDIFKLEAPSNPSLESSV